MPFPFLAVGMGLVSGITNLIAGNEAEAQYNRRRELAISQLREGLIDSGELSKMLRNQDRLFNSRLQGVLNTTALRTRGLANRGVVGAAAAGQIAGRQAQARISTDLAVRNSNTGINQAIARTQLGGPENSPTGNFFTGALGGITAGIELEQLINREEPPAPGNIPGADNFETPVQPGFVPGTQGGGLSGISGPTQNLANPFLGVPKIEDDYLFNFQSPSTQQRFFRGF